MSRSRTGIVAVCVIALVAGVAVLVPIGGADDAPDRGVIQVRADAICRHAAGEASQLPRRSIAWAAGMASLLRSTASRLRYIGADDLAWAHQRWAAAIDDVRQALRRRGGSPKAGATELVSRREAAAAAGAFGAKDCARLALRT
jgi:hypothetical protein